MNPTHQQMPNAQGFGMPNLNMMMPMIPHMENLQQMDKTHLEGLLLQLVEMIGPDTISEISKNPAQMQQILLGGQMRMPN